MVYACAVRDGGSGRIWVCVDDFVAALFTFADYGGDAAEDALAFKGGAVIGGAVFGVVAVEDFGLGEQARAGVWKEVWGQYRVFFGCDAWRN